MDEYHKYSKLPYYRTEVSISRTQEKIKKLLKKYGLQAIKFIEGYDIGNYVGVIEFILQKDNPLQFRFNFNLTKDERFHSQIYRGLFHYLKARFTSVDFGINTIEREFISEIVLKLPNGTSGTMKEIYGNKILKLHSIDGLLPFKEDK